MFLFIFFQLFYCALFFICRHFAFIFLYIFAFLLLFLFFSFFSSSFVLFCRLSFSPFYHLFVLASIIFFFFSYILFFSLFLLNPCFTLLSIFSDPSAVDSFPLYVFSFLLKFLLMFFSFPNSYIYFFLLNIFLFAFFLFSSFPFPSTFFLFFFLFSLPFFFFLDFSFSLSPFYTLLFAVVHLFLASNHFFSAVWFQIKSFQRQTKFTRVDKKSVKTFLFPTSVERKKNECYKTRWSIVGKRWWTMLDWLTVNNWWRHNQELCAYASRHKEKAIFRRRKELLFTRT